MIIVGDAGSVLVHADDRVSIICTAALQPRQCIMIRSQTPARRPPNEAVVKWAGP